MNTGFLPRTLNRRSETYRYQVHVPTTNTTRSVVLYLHGKGGGGRDGVRHTKSGLADAIRSNPVAFPFLAIFPQSPDDSEFVGDTQELVLQILNATLATEDVDRSRVYAVGSSMGGHGVYHLVERCPKLFAAYVVSCASPFLPKWRSEALGRGSEPDQDGVLRRLASAIAPLPGWIFHGVDDEVVRVSEARRTVQALRTASADIRYTEYPEGGHELCGQPYRDQQLWTWLLAQRRR